MALCAPPWIDCSQVRGWQRLWARFDRDPDLLLIELAARPLRLLWSVLTRKSAGRTTSPRAALHLLFGSNCQRIARRAAWCLAVMRDTRRSDRGLSNHATLSLCLVTSTERLEDAMKAGWDAAEDEGKAAELLAEHRRNMRRGKHNNRHSAARMSTAGGRPHPRQSVAAGIGVASAGGVSGRVYVKSATGRRSVAGVSDYDHFSGALAAAREDHSPVRRHDSEAPTTSPGDVTAQQQLLSWQAKSAPVRAAPPQAMPRYEDSNEDARAVAAVADLSPVRPDGVRIDVISGGGGAFARKSGAIRAGPFEAAVHSSRHRVSVAGVGAMALQRAPSAVSSRHRISVAVRATSAGRGASSPSQAQSSHYAASFASAAVAAEQQRLHVPEIDAVYDATVADAKALRRKRWVRLSPKPASRLLLLILLPAASRGDF